MVKSKYLIFCLLVGLFFSYIALATTPPTMPTGNVVVRGDIGWQGSVNNQGQFCTSENWRQGITDNTQLSPCCVPGLPASNRMHRLCCENPKTTETPPRNQNVWDTNTNSCSVANYIDCSNTCSANNEYCCKHRKSSTCMWQSGSCRDRPTDCDPTTISNCILPRTDNNQYAGSCASGYNGNCRYLCHSRQWQSGLSQNGVLLTYNNCSLPRRACLSTTISNCSLVSVSHDSTAGSCVSGYTGACSYRCNNGNWNSVSNTCTVGRSCRVNLQRIWSKVNGSRTNRYTYRNSYSYYGSNPNILARRSNFTCVTYLGVNGELPSGVTRRGSCKKANYRPNRLHNGVWLTEAITKGYKGSCSILCNNGRVTEVTSCTPANSCVNNWRGGDPVEGHTKNRITVTGVNPQTCCDGTWHSGYITCPQNQ